MIELFSLFIACFSLIMSACALCGSLKAARESEKLRKEVDDYAKYYQ